MTPAALKFVEQNFDTFCEWFAQKDELVQEGFDTMEPGIRWLIEWAHRHMPRPKPKAKLSAQLSLFEGENDETQKEAE